MSARSEQVAAHLWAKGEVFSFGTLTGPPHPRLGYSNIKKIIAYAKNKGKLGFPRLSYAIWRHIACNKLQISDELAWLYFETYLLTADTVDDVEERCSIVGSGDSEPDGVRVDARRFVLFLYVQLLQKISFRSSLLVSSDEWPLQRTRSPDLDAGSGNRNGSGPCTRSLDEHAHLTFIMQHLGDMLELLAEVRPASAAASSSPSGAAELVVDVHALAALGMFIGGSLDKNRTVTALEKIALHPLLQAKSGYLKPLDCFNYRTLLSWLRGSFGVSPFGVSLCITHGKRLSWLPADTPPSLSAPSVGSVGSRGKIGTNDHLLDRACIKGNRLVIATRVCKQTVARASGKLDGATVKIHRCHQSFFYLLAPLRSVSVEKCRDTTVVLGPVEVTVLVHGCENVRVIAPCARVVISSSTLCSLYVLTPTRPLILNGCDGLQLAPYNTFYPALEQHARAVRLPLDVNRWDQPFCCFGHASSGEHHGSSSGESASAWELVPPKDFHVFVTPFEMEGTTAGVPGPLSIAYRKTISSRQHVVDLWQKHIQEVGLTPSQQKAFQSLIEQRFQDWLAETSYKRELDGLMVHIEAKSKKLVQ